MADTAEKIRDLPAFSFGLWPECPEGAKVAWGARGIADNGVGFSLLPDRQTWVGDAEARASFSKLLNDGPLRKANERCRQLREGWTPARDLNRDNFIAYWELRREDPGLLSIMLATAYVDRSALLYAHLEDERVALERFYVEDEKRIADYEQNTPPPPAPPAHCEGEDGDGNECGQKFTKASKGEYDGCYAEDDAWVCETCGEWHSFDEDDDWPTAPGTPILDTVSRIVGYQPAKMRNDKNETFTLYEDNQLAIKGNTNASYGYVYLIAYPKEG